ncbi:uncharacterized protein LOC131859675 [Cryptomeria japonica]|uniref:uncharacterized protein LOC131859675 n=1 Tax=Cryptomeria japonica TaxID=3369 RepID=UPI0027DAA095|nr:uncharacterized protein LOC131859675 [Cryptomeria japonica]
MSRIMSTNTWTLCMRSFTTTHRRGWNNATAFHNRSASAHTLSKGDKEDVNQVEKAIMRDSQVYSTTAVKTTKDPDSPGANTGSGSQHNKVTTQEHNKVTTQEHNKVTTK